MLIWGGNSEGTLVATGGRYDPFTDSWQPLSTVDAPAARYLHGTTWSDTEMIVWGGVGQGGHLNTGGRYDPLTDTWQPMTTVGAPEPRRFHTTVWTGGEMVVWGGRDGPFGGLNTWFQSGGRYDPVADVWVPTSLVDAPSARAAHVGVWTGTQMVVWGGCAGNSFCNADTATGGRYDPFSDTWTATSLLSAASARNNHSVVWTGEEMIVWGGYAVQASTYTSTGGRYCGASK